MMKLMLMAGLAAGLMTTTAMAVGGADSPSFRACMAHIDMNALTNSQRLACATSDMDRADGTLNAVYKQVMAGVPADRRHALVIEERRWIDQRHRTCAIKAAAPQPLDEFNRMRCLVSETDARTARLRAWR